MLRVTPHTFKQSGSAMARSVMFLSLLKDWRTYRELEAATGKDERTIRRYFERLREAGVEVETQNTGDGKVLMFRASHVLQRRG
jgi:predicted DNA-binding transcriptional regulator YafY